MFWLIDFIVVRPIVNILFVIYNFVGDFGLAIIIFTIIVKFLMWPLVKRQIQQTKLMRKIQPELAEIKKNCKGNRQLESLQMMDLYKRNNVKPFRTVITTIIQLPIFLALFMAISAMVNPRPSADTCGYTNVENCAYEPVRNMDRIKDITEKQDRYLSDVEAAKAAAQENSSKDSQGSQSTDENTDTTKAETTESADTETTTSPVTATSETAAESKPEEAKTEETKSEESKPETPVYDFEPKLFGIIDLSVSPSDVFRGKINVSTIVILLFAIGASALQFFMARQQNPTDKTKKSKSFRQLLKESSGKDGKSPDQAEISAVASRQMTGFMPIMMFFIMFYLPGALVFYYLLSNAITVVQQKIALKQTEDEMEISADKAVLKELRNIKEAEVIENKKTGTKITRISAKDTKAAAKAKTKATKSKTTKTSNVSKVAKASNASAKAPKNKRRK